MNKKKDVLTTGEVAKICNVAPRTVTKWFDSGQLRGYRIPGSRDRRIPTAELIRFMKAHNMPTDGIEKGQMRVLIIDANADTSRRFAETLQIKGSFEARCATNSFDAGLLAEKFKPQVILINLMAGQINAQQLCSYVRQQQDLQDTKVIAIAAGLNGNESASLQKKGFDAILTDPADVNQAVKLIQECCAVVY
jgi:excisionase family DNA binding protein